MRFRFRDAGKASLIILVVLSISAMGVYAQVPSINADYPNQVEVGSSLSVKLSVSYSTPANYTMRTIQVFISDFAARPVGNPSGPPCMFTNTGYCGFNATAPSGSFVITFLLKAPQQSTDWRLNALVVINYSKPVMLDSMGERSEVIKGTVSVQNQIPLRIAVIQSTQSITTSPQPTYSSLIIVLGITVLVATIIAYTLLRNRPKKR